MSKRGRKPKPTAVKNLQGNPGKRALPKNEIQPDDDLPKLPYGIPWTEARKFWKQNAEALNRVGLLSKVDGPAYLMMSIHYAVALEAARQLGKGHIEEEGGGLVVDGARGGLVKNPLTTILNQNSQMFRRYATEFGMTPSARAGKTDPNEGEQMSLADALFSIVEKMESGD